MSKEALAKVIKRSLSDPAFRRRISTDTTALSGFDLTADETAALRSGDPGKLAAFGIDQRMSKIFMIDPGNGASVVAGTSSVPRDVEPYWVGGSEDAVPSGGAEPRDVEPYWAGGASDAVTSGGTDGATDALAGAGNEPRDIEPYWTGDGSDAVPGAGNEPRDVEPTDISTTYEGTHGES